MVIAYQVQKVDRVDGRYVVDAYGPVSTLTVGSTVYANDGIILDVVNVFPVPGRDDYVTIRAVKAIPDIGPAVSVSKWKTLYGGEGAQWHETGGVKPPDNPLWDPGAWWAAIPPWAKWGAVGAAVIYVAPYFLGGDE